MHHATVKSPVVGDVTRTVGMLAGAMTNVVTTVPTNIVGLAPTNPDNNVDPHVLTGIAVPCSTQPITHRPYGSHESGFACTLMLPIL